MITAVALNSRKGTVSRPSIFHVYAEDVPITESPTTPAVIRSAAARELLKQLEALVSAYAELPAEERVRQCAQDAERITAEVARHLSTARTKIQTVPRRH
jgi:hypothetical protein